MGRYRAAVAGAAALVLLIAIATIFHNTVVLAGVRLVAASMGYTVAFGRFQVGVASATLVHPYVQNKAGEPVFEAERIDLGYSLRDALPGGKRRFGLSSVDVQRPKVTLIHHPDGTYNVAIPNLTGPQKQQAAPFNLRIRIRDGSIAMIDRYTAFPQERRQRIVGVAFDGVLSPTEHSFYNARFDLNDGHRLYPVVGTATFDDAQGYESQHWIARQLPIGPLVDFMLSSHSINLTAGDLYGAELRIFSLADASGAMHGHMMGTADLRGGKIYFTGIEKPLRDAAGRLDVYDDGITVRRLDAKIADVPIVAAGGVYDFGNPTIRIGAQGIGELARLRRVSAAAAQRPIEGRLAFRLLAEGPLSKPLLLAGFAAPSIAYRTLTVTRPHGIVALQGPEVDIVGARLRYGPVDLTARGTMLLRKQLSVDIVASAAGPSDRLPYAAQMVPHMPLAGVAVVSGVDRDISFVGALNGASQSQQLDAVANVAPDGTGTVGPITIDGTNGRFLYARVALDRPANRNLVVVDANRFWIRPGKIAALPGLPVNRLPQLDGVLDGHVVALQEGPGLAYLGGDARVGPVHVEGMKIDDLLAQGTYAHGDLDVLADLHGDVSSLRRYGVPLSAGRFNAIALIGGRLSNPHATVATLLDGGRIAQASVSGSAELSYAGDRLRIERSSLMFDGAHGYANGTVSGLRGSGPRFDVDAHVRAADVALLANAFHLRVPHPEGTIDADVHLGGSSKRPAIAGAVNVPEASINGLAFHGATRFGGDRAQGRLVVGSTALNFDAAVGAGRQTLALRGDKVNLSDFNDFFDQADTLHGRGRVALNLDAGASGLSTSGDIAISDARFRRFAFGNTTARWSTKGAAVVAVGDVVGPAGRLHLDGDAQLASRASYLNVRAAARGFDLGVWLPAAGITAPVLGLLDADASIRGPVTSPLLTANAELHDGIIDRVPVNRFTIAASAGGGLAHITSASFEIPNLSAKASGTFGLQPGAPLDLTARADSPDIGALAKGFGKPYPVAGTLASDLRVTGTMRAPLIEDTVDLTGFRYAKLEIPHAHAEIAATQKALNVRNGAVAFHKGALDFDAQLPFERNSFALGPANAPLSGRLFARAIDLGQFAALLPKKSTLAGTLEGAVLLGGTYVAPLLNGALALNRGYFSSPDETSPLTNIAAYLVLAGTRMTLSRAHADVGGGTLDAAGNASVADLRDPLHQLAFDLTARANHALFNVPQFYHGKIDGTLTARQSPGSPPLLGGYLAFYQARIPLAGILNETKPHPSSGPPPRVAFDLHLNVGPDVRIQSPNVDVGGIGAVALGGTLAQPTLDGTLSSTGGNIDFYRSFQLRRATVAFSADRGVIPDIDAVATTYIADPSTSVRLRATGPVTEMNLALSSNPPYDRAQIVGLLTGLNRFGAVSGVAAAEGIPQPSPLTGITEGYVNQLFTRNILEPLQTTLGSALGFQNVQFNYDLAGNEGFSGTFRRGLGRNMDLLFTSSYGFPSRTTFAIADRLNKDSLLRFTIFNTYGQEGLGYYSPYLLSQPGTNISLQASQPAAGENGFSLHYVRHFK